MQLLRTMLVACAALGALGTARADKTYYCEVREQMKAEGKTQVTLAKYWGKSPTEFRIERSVGSQSEYLITSHGDIWRINPQRKIGLHGHLPPQAIAQYNAIGRPIGNDLDRYLKAGAKKTGQETIDGVRCDVYRLTDKGGAVATLWVIPGPDKLTRRQVTIANAHTRPAPGKPSRPVKVEATTDFLNWQIGKPIDQALFRPPAGIKISEAPTPPAVAGAGRK